MTFDTEPQAEHAPPPIDLCDLPMKIKEALLKAKILYFSPEALRHLDLPASEIDQLVLEVQRGFDLSWHASRESSPIIRNICRGPGTGKSFEAAVFARNALDSGQTVIWFDTEGSATAEYFRVNQTIGSFTYFRTFSPSELLATCRILSLCDHLADIVVVDSVASSMKYESKGSLTLLFDLCRSIATHSVVFVNKTQMKFDANGMERVACLGGAWRSLNGTLGDP